MLRQILRDLWVDPEVLAELDDAQRAALFCRMRAEQVRRWEERERQGAAAAATAAPSAGATANATANAAPRTGSKQVHWLLGADGEPWVWVMGEHPDDLSVEEMVAQDHHNSSLEEEVHEAQDDEPHHQIHQEVPPQPQQPPVPMQEPVYKDKLEAQHREELMPSSFSQDEEGIYCTVDDLRIAIDNSNTTSEKRGALQEISLNMPERAEKVSQRVALWERRVAEERGHQRPQRRRREITARQAEEQRLQQEEEERAWLEQERKAKEAEQQIREIARRAREEHRRTSVLAMEVEPSHASSSSLDSTNSVLTNVSISASPTAKPPSTEAVVQWFRSSEIARRAGFAPGTNLVATWFHGLISRQEAEQRLESAPVGSFLVRLSERVWGYAVSYRSIERCKHFLIDASSGHYQFLGANQLSHGSLGELIEYHGRHPITILGGERLLHSCARSELPSVFQGLLNPLCASLRTNT